MTSYNSNSSLKMNNEQSSPIKVNALVSRPTSTYRQAKITRV